MDQNEANMILRLQESEIRLRQQLQSQQQENQHYRQQIQYRDRQSRPSTFLEHVYNCHSMLHSKLSIEPNPELRSKGTTTAIFSKAHPVIVKQWIGFPEKQKALFDEISNVFPPDHRVFESLKNMENLGTYIEPIANEFDLDRLHHFTLEVPVVKIMTQLKLLFISR
ncbi:hypothetical protein E4U47_002595 [Claviceps purpurea]|nr:hypothetical protein E4U38_005715 [Claviceps purpurea]KAG6156041.1 hypothetical protein E4U11_005782 [Claviceps purpurea]KAG6272284.1 hypothetical protein E4U47_002595 [Claviceps purpurea]